MRITSKLTGGFRFENAVRGHNVVVDLGPESGGGDSGPTPPEMLAISLGTCVGVYAINFCKKHGLSTEGLEVYTDFEKADTPPARIGVLQVTVHLPAGVPDEKMPAFMRTVEQCLVHNTLCAKPEITIEVGEKQG